MKRSTMLVLFSCVALAGSAWMVHVVSGQTAAEPPKEKTFTVTQSQLDDYVAKRVAKAVAEEREKAPRANKPPTDDEIFNPQNWHKVIFNDMEWVVYTGPGTAIMHHWVAPKGAKPAATNPPATAKPGK